MHFELHANLQGVHSMGYNSLQVFLSPPPYLCAWSLKNTLEAVINQLRRCTKARLSPDAYQTFSLLSNVRLERKTQQPAHPPPPRAGKVKRVLAVCLCVCGSPSRLHYLCSSGAACIFVACCGAGRLCSSIQDPPLVVLCALLTSVPRV